LLATFGRTPELPLMIPITTEWTLVLAGGWNANIFQPDWVAKHVFSKEEINVEFLLGPQQGTLSFVSGDVTLLVRPDKLIFGCKNTSDQALASIEAAGLQTLELLPHTPVAAFGINFGFHEENPSSELIHLFQTDDLDPISKAGCTIQKTSLIRQVMVENRTLNVTHALENSQVHVSLNFHFPATNATAAREKLPNTMIPCRDIAKKLLADVYKLALPET
jgi:hypothetical protein